MKCKVTPNSLFELIVHCVDRIAREGVLQIPQKAVAYVKRAIIRKGVSVLPMTQLLPAVALKP